MKLTSKFIAILFSATILFAGSCVGSDDSRADRPRVFASTGVIRGMDLNKKVVVLDHQDIPGFMSAMTMDFRVRDDRMLDQFSIGDTVDFEISVTTNDAEITKMTKTGVDELVKGANVFGDNCARCHGDSGEGSRKGISLVEGHALDHSEEQFLERVRNGKTDKMPSFGEKLTEEEIKSVVRYVREVIQKGLDRRDSEEIHEH